MEKGKAVILRHGYPERISHDVSVAKKLSQLLDFRGQHFADWRRCSILLVLHLLLAALSSSFAFFYVPSFHVSCTALMYDCTCNITYLVASMGQFVVVARASAANCKLQINSVLSPIPYMLAEDGNDKMAEHAGMPMPI